jgi:hypothetical protein
MSLCDYIRVVYSRFSCLWCHACILRIKYMPPYPFQHPPPPLPICHSRMFIPLLVYPRHHHLYIITFVFSHTLHLCVLSPPPPTPSPSGGAPGHRDDHATRPRAVAVARRRRTSAAGQAGGAADARTRGRGQNVRLAIFVWVLCLFNCLSTVFIYDQMVSVRVLSISLCTC